MSAHFSKFYLNTYAATPYFQAHVSADYPLGTVLIRCRAFRRLPPRLRELAALAKAWAKTHYPHPAGIEGIERWYDDAGNELDPDSGRRLTDAEIDAQWDAEDFGPAELVDDDIPLPIGGFADPLRWAPPPDPPDLVDRSELTESQVLDDIASRGREAAAAEYGVPPGWLADVRADRELAALILGMDGKPWPEDG